MTTFVPHRVQKKLAPSGPRRKQLITPDPQLPQRIVA
jgi:hypothetical protein